MRLERVTITGADDKINPEDIISISKMFPFVEWGILFSPSRQGTPRYPSFDWINRLKEKTDVSHAILRFSAHFCGDYTKEIIETGDNKLIGENNCIKEFGHMFNRVQLNFNATKHTISDEFYDFIKRDARVKIIIQSNKANRDVCAEIIKRQIPVHFLWDSSGGRGIANDNEWSVPFFNHFTGYAGGLTPDNLEGKLSKFFKFIFGDETDIWIDAESGVRTDDNLDMDKVVKFLEIASEYTEHSKHTE